MARHRVAGESGEGYNPLPLCVAILFSIGGQQLYAQAATTTPAGEWTAYGHDALGSRYSPLAQVTRENVTQGKLPGGARATPMTYQVTSNGRQFVVVSVGGSEEWGSGDYVVAFALPATRR
jgi:glucose dehydrogenase